MWFMSRVSLHSLSYYCFFIVPYTISPLHTWSHLPVILHCVLMPLLSHKIYHIIFSHSPVIRHCVVLMPLVYFKWHGTWNNEIRCVLRLIRFPSAKRNKEHTEVGWVERRFEMSWHANKGECCDSRVTDFRSRADIILFGCTHKLDNEHLYSVVVTAEYY